MRMPIISNNRLIGNRNGEERAVKYLLLSLYALVLSSCAVSHVTSIKAPTHPRYAKILINATYSDVDDKTNYELAMQQSLGSLGVASIRSVDAFPPLREYSDSEVSNWIAANGVDAVMVLSPNGVSTGSSTSYNALTDSYDTHESVDAIYLDASVLDVSSDQTVYKASITTKLGSLTEITTARLSATDEICKDLQANNYLLPTQKPRKPGN